LRRLAAQPLRPPDAYAPRFLLLLAGRFETEASLATDGRDAVRSDYLAYVVSRSMGLARFLGDVVLAVSGENPMLT
jgi:hypothetical protein